MAAADHGNLGILQWCLENAEIKANAVNNRGDSLLIAAARKDQDEIVSYLISRGAHINHQNDQETTALISVCEAPSDAILGLNTYFEHK